MDLVTQIQSYVSKEAELCAHALEYLDRGCQAVSLDALPTERDDARFDLVEEKAQQLFQRVAEADVLICSLPDKFASEDEQLQEIRELQLQNTLAGQRLEKAKQQADLWQRRISNVVQKIASENLSIGSSSRRDK